MGILFITHGYAHQMRPSCEKGVEVKYVPRDVYDGVIFKSKPYSEETYIIIIYKYDKNSVVPNLSFSLSISQISPGANLFNLLIISFLRTIGN